MASAGEKLLDYNAIDAASYGFVLAAVLAAVDRLGYKGFVACEYRPRGRTEDGLGWARAYGVVPNSK